MALVATRAGGILRVMALFIALVILVIYLTSSSPSTAVEAPPIHFNKVSLELFVMSQCPDAAFCETFLDKALVRCSLRYVSSPSRFPHQLFYFILFYFIN